MPDKVVKTGHVTPEMICEVMDRMVKGEIHRPLWTVEPYPYSILTKKIDRE